MADAPDPSGGRSAAVPQPSPRVGLLINGRGLAAALEAVARDGAAGLPLLDPSSRRRLLAAVRRLPYRPGKPVVGEGRRQVRQRFVLSMDIPAGHVAWALAGALDDALAAACSHLPARFAGAVAGFNDLIVQRYEPGALGITPHRDHIRYTGVVAIVILGGSARFCICRDRSGRGAREISCPPGGAILMRAPGMVWSPDRPGADDRPFHFVSDIRCRRYTIGLRHDSRRPEAV
jgi:hypothetical protein